MNKLPIRALSAALLCGLILAVNSLHLFQTSKSAPFKSSSAKP